MEQLNTGDVAFAFLLGRPKREEPASVADDDSYDLISLNGFYLDENDFYFGAEISDAVPRLTLLDARHANGEWLGIFQHRTDENSFAIAADSFGYMSTFVKVVEHGDGISVLVASSALAMGYLQRRLGLRVDVDWVHASAWLSSPHTIAATIYSDDTVVQGVRLLRQGEVLYISPDSVTFKRADPYATADSRSYEDLLSSGVEKAIGQLRRVSGVALQHRISLSGGKDSRVMLALISAAGMTNAFEVSATDPNSWPNTSARASLATDLRIADYLRGLLGMSWARRSTPVVYSIQPDESVRAWQSYRSNWNTNFRASSKRFIYADTSTELRGAAGEAFRTFGANYFRGLEAFASDGSGAHSIAEGARAAFGRIFSSGQLTNEIRSEAEQRFVNEFVKLGGSTPTEAANRHWTAFRNRGHFGHVRHSVSHGALPIFPLAQWEFVSAAQQLGSEDRADGRVLHDLIELLAPELNDVEFESGPWPGRFRSQRARLISRAGVSASGATTNGLAGFADNQRDFESRKRNASQSPSLGQESLESFVRERAKELLIDLTDLEGGAAALPTRLIKGMLDSSATDLSMRSRLLAKAQSVKDLTVGTAPSRTRVFDLRFGVADMLGHTRPVSVHLPDTWSRGTAPLTQRVIVASNDGETLRVAVVVRQSADRELEHAFYLNVNGNKNSVRWYEPDNTATFSAPVLSGELSVTAFTRYCGTDAPVCITTEPISRDLASLDRV